MKKAFFLFALAAILVISGCQTQNTHPCFPLNTPGCHHDTSTVHTGGTCDTLAITFNDDTTFLVNTGTYTYDSTIYYSQLCKVDCRGDSIWSPLVRTGASSTNTGGSGTLPGNGYGYAITSAMEGNTTAITLTVGQKIWAIVGNAPAGCAGPNFLFPNVVEIQIVGIDSYGRYTYTLTGNVYPGIVYIPSHYANNGASDALKGAIQQAFTDYCRFAQVLVQNYQTQVQ